MKQEFIDFVTALMEAAPHITMSESVKSYWDAYVANDINAKPEITDNGKVVLTYLQKNPTPAFKTKDVAEGLFVSSRMVSGSLRKLVNDGFVEKISTDPIIYALTEKGKNYKIED